MVTIEEKPAIKLPNLTSLFFKLPFINSHIKQTLDQEFIVLHKDTLEYELPITRLFFIVSLLTAYDDVLFRPYKNENITNKSVDETIFKVKPYDYQLDGIQYGLNHNGWLLLDEMGLGKTLQMIYLAETLKNVENIEHCLIICGVNGLKYNWESEIKKFSDLSYTILGQKITKTGKRTICSVDERCNLLKENIKEFFVITNIETLQNKKFADAFNKSKNKFGMIVFDEAHKAKNPSSLASKTLLKLNSPHNIALTGTLLTNNPENAFIPLKWTGNLNCTYSAFKSMYNVYGGFNNVQVIGHKNLNLLQEHINSCSLRRLKDSVLSLPPKNYQIEYVELGSKQRAFYDEVAKGIAERLDLLPYKNKLTLAQEMVLNMRLRQITAYPGVLSSECKESAKLDRLTELVDGITSNNNKVLIFCTFKSTVPEIVNRLSSYNPLICTGDQTDDEINKNKDIFQSNNDRKVLVATWQKMGTGLTLTEANYVIFIDTPFTRASFDQACDRINRIGQNKPMFFITLIAKDTYDERVQEIIDTKKLMSDYVLDNISDSDSDINYLLNQIDYITV